MVLLPAQAVGTGSSSQTARSYRHPICTLAYVRIDHSNGGIIRNLSDSGMAIQAVGRLHPEQVVHLRFEFIRPRAKFELVGQVAWADAKGQAGLRFADVPLRTRRLLKDWMLTDLLTATWELTGAPVLQAAEADDGLIMSSFPMRPIRLAAAETGVITPEELAREVSQGSAYVNLPWWPAGIRQRTFARLVDGTMIVSAVLLFSIIVVRLTEALPSWRMLATIGLALVLVFGVVYYGFFRFIVHCTLGTRLAQLAADDRSASRAPSAWDSY